MPHDTVLRSPAGRRLPPLEVENDHPDWVVYRGWPAVLVRDAAFPPEWFAGQGKRRRYIEHAGRKCEVSRYGKNQWMVYVTRTPAERAEAEKRDVAAQKWAQARRILRAWPKAAADWRKTAEKMMDWGVTVIQLESSGFGLYSGGFQFDQDSVDEIAMHLNGIKAAITSATVVFDPERRDWLRQRVMEPVYEADPAFARLMSSVDNAGAPPPR